MKDLNPAQIVRWLGVIALSLIAGWYGLNLEIGPDGLKLTHPPVMLDQEQ